MTTELKQLVFETRDEFRDYCNPDLNCELPKIICETIFNYMYNSDTEVIHDEESGMRFIPIAELIVVEDGASITIQVDVDEIENVLNLQLGILESHEEYELCKQITSLLQVLNS